MARSLRLLRPQFCFGGYEQARPPTQNRLRVLRHQPLEKVASQRKIPLRGRKRAQRKTITTIYQQKPQSMSDF
jgi:hypothetical protein